jgi:outer membrane protein OmpA-like peptidoglycan-associated protein
MIRARSGAFAIAALAAAFAPGCGPKRVRPSPEPGPELVVILPDQTDGTVGRAVVTTPAGSVELAAARESASVSPNRPMPPVTVMSEASVQQLFGDVLAALPMAPEHFMLHFLFESDSLTEESRALLPQILQAARRHPYPDVAVIGHTDTTGSAAGNFELGLRRANAIRTSLIEAGIDRTLIDVTSHGEADLLVKTADGVADPRNRRVEITIR